MQPGDGSTAADRERLGGLVAGLIKPFRKTQ
jgi:hypothetical protein